MVGSTYVYGMRVDIAARRAAEELGMGLLTSRGEQVPPRAPFAGI